MVMLDLLQFYLGKVYMMEKRNDTSGGLVCFGSIFIGECDHRHKEGKICTKQSPNESPTKTKTFKVDYFLIQALYLTTTTLKSGHRCTLFHLERPNE